MYLRVLYVLLNEESVRFLQVSDTDFILGSEGLDIKSQSLKATVVEADTSIIPGPSFTFKFALLARLFSHSLSHTPV